MPQSRADYLFPFRISNAADGRAEISIRGTIGVPKKYADFVEAGGTITDFEKGLKELGDVKQITLRVFSRGGDIFQAAAIRDVLESHPARIVAQVDGLAASAASWIILAADEVRMPANAWMVIHNAQGFEIGDHRAMKKMADDLERYTQDIAREYAARSKASQGANATSLKKFRALMDDTTRLNGNEAKALGLVDVVLNDVALSAEWIGNDVREAPGISPEQLPPEIRALFDTPPSPVPAHPNPANTTDDMKPEEIQALISTGIKAGITDALKAHADETTKSITALRDGLKTEIANALKPELENATKPITDRLDALDKKTAGLDDLAKRLETAENLLKSGVANSAGGTKPVGDAGSAGEGEEKPKAPANATPAQLFAFGLRQAAKNATLPSPAAAN